MISNTVAKNRIRELRARLGLRQVDLAREIGVSRQSIIAIERCRLHPSVLLALRIARVLREPVDYVFYLVPADLAVERVEDMDRTAEGPSRLHPPEGDVRISARQDVPEAAAGKMPALAGESAGFASGSGRMWEEEVPGKAIWDFPEN